jgi:hypothetical protein
MTRKTFYDVLGLPRDADEAAIKAAFRGLAKRYHPDVRGDDTESGAIFLIISEAYDNLIDRDRRREYDRYLAKVAGRPSLDLDPRRAGGTAIDDAISELNAGIWDLIDWAKSLSRSRQYDAFAGQIYDRVIDVLGVIERDALDSEERYAYYKSQKPSVLKLENYLFMMQFDLTRMIAEIQKTPEHIQVVLEANRAIRRALLELD